MGKLFGTDGVRGVANRGLTADIALRLGAAAAKVLINKPHGFSVLIGRDPRISGDMLESALAAGFASRGADVILVGVIPTPGVASLVQHTEAEFGAVISASHNSVEYNGIKLFGPDGEKLPDDTEHEIEVQMDNLDKDELPIGINVGRFIRRPDLINHYIQEVKKSCPHSLEGLKLVIDASNGAASEIAPRLFRELGAQVLTVNCSPDGGNINENCGSLYPQIMQSLVVSQGASAGLAFDGDADRVILADENGDLVDGDRTMAICAVDFASRGALPGNRVVATVMSNLGLEKALQEHGILLDRTELVGDRYVAERMRETGAVLGGEKSGHIILSGYTTTGDGMITALQVLGIMARTGRSLSDLGKVMQELPQLLDGVKVKDRKGWEQKPEICDAIKRAEDILSGRGRIHVRASGTEPLIRVMAEGPDQAELKELVESVCGAIRQACS